MIERVVWFSKLLGSARSLEEVCRAIVQSDEFGHDLHGTQFHSLTNRGNLVSAASFGIEGLASDEKLTMFDDHPISDSARERKLTTATHPHLDGYELWSMPILKGELTAGTLCGVGKKGSNNHGFSELEVIAIGNMSYLYLSASGIPDIVKDQETSTNGKLTNRQSEILVFMSQGMTNMNIADQLSLSESSIKQESVKIFRALGVNKRKDAVNIAKERGLIADQSVVS